MLWATQPIPLPALPYSKACPSWVPPVLSYFAGVVVNEEGFATPFSPEGGKSVRLYRGERERGILVTTDEI